MNPLTTNKVIAYLALIFVAGGATGAVITLKNAREREAQPPSMEKVCTRIQDRLRVRLGLTDEQIKQLQPIFDQTAQQLRAIHSKAICDTDEVIGKAHELISPLLTPQQRAKLEEFDNERRDWLDRRLNEHGSLPKNR